MANVINTNMPSLFAQRNLGKSQSLLETSLQRLSSGLRINNAKDDSAGQSIAERMTAQIRGLDQAVRNANDGVSLAQTAEGGMNDVATGLQRLRELAVQSANATNTDLDRDAIQEEATQIVTEIDRIGTQTDFNGIKLLDGTFKEQKFQVGANAHQTIGVTMNSVRSSSLGVASEAAVNSRQGRISTTATAETNLHSLNQGDLIINGVQVGTALATDDQASSRAADLSAIAKAAAVNKVSDQSGVKAVVNETVAKGQDMTPSGAVFSGSSGTMNINGTNIAFSTTTFTQASAARSSIITAINSVSDRTGVSAEDGGDEGGVVLKAADGRNIAVSYMSGTGGAGAANPSSGTGVRSGIHLGSFSLVSDKAITLADSGGSANISDVGLFEGTYSTQKAVVSTEADLSTSFNAGDFKINGAVIGKALSIYDNASSKAGNMSAIAKARAINEISAQSGVQAVVNKNLVKGVAVTAADTSGTLSINGIATRSISTYAASSTNSRADAVAAINEISDRTGVQAIDTGTDTYGVKLMAADGRNIVISNLGGLTSAASGVKIASQSVQYGSISLVSGSAFTVEAGFNGNAGLDQLKVGAGTYGQGRDGDVLDKLDLTTAAGATKALKSIDNAIGSINKERGKLGAVQNRFGSTISNLQTQGENITAARSRIQDADFAKESAQMTRAQILQQAGVAMLSQANQLPQQVLQLLGG